MNTSKLIGKEVRIKSSDSWMNDQWGIVVDYDGEFYYVAPYGGNDMTLQFSRDEIVVKRKTN